MSIRVRRLGRVEYKSTYQAMLEYVAERSTNENGVTEPPRGDEFWCLQHPPVYTLGKAGKREHILNPGDIEIIETDRGGQVTYHGPGQLIVYILLRLKDYDLGPKSLVRCIENAVIGSLSRYALQAQRRDGAPGVYLGDKKIASLGLRIKNGISYHGVAVNVDMDLSPFNGINPCGYAGLEVTRLTDHVADASMAAYAEVLVNQLLNHIAPDARHRLAS